MEVLEQCGLWMATSTIPNAGLGLFAGRAYEKEEAFHPAGTFGDLAIPVIDMWLQKDSKLEEDPNHYNLLDSYTWAMPGNHREGWLRSDLTSPGLGALPNGFLPLVNVFMYDAISYDVGLHRSKDPGAGATTYYYNRISVARSPRPGGGIRPGEELFVDYGDIWFLTRQNMATVPLKNDLNRADDLVRMFKQKYLNSPTTTEQRETTLMGDSSVVHVSLQEQWESFLIQNNFNDTRVLSVFYPFNETEMTLLLDGKTNFTQIKIEESSRSIEWLQQHGTCADNIYASHSTIKQAGMGAFASRVQKKDSVVVSLPLIHILDKSDLEIPHFTYNSDDGVVFHWNRGVRSRQLLLNYCMGHRESSLLLCSYAPMASYINHNQTLANVKLQWTTIHTNRHADLFERDVSDFGYADRLVMDVIALRDIEEGEEIFLDYGDDWEQAWQDHVNNWRPVESAETYLSARELNEEKALFTIFENIQLGRFSMDAELFCHEYYLTNDWQREYEELGWDEVDYRRLKSESHRCDIMRRYATNITNYFLYDAILWRKDDSNRPQVVGKIVDVPREAFLFKDLPYATDINLHNAFRHDIRIPDDMFPDAWRNIRHE